MDNGCSFLQIRNIFLALLGLIASKAAFSSVNLTLLAMWAGRWLCPEVVRQGLITEQSCEWMPSAVNGPYTYKFTLADSRVESYIHTERHSRQRLWMWNFAKSTLKSQSCFMLIIHCFHLCHNFFSYPFAAIRDTRMSSIAWTTW